MGYDVHIVRNNEWWDEDDGGGISFEEWETYLDSDPTMRMDGFAEADTAEESVLRYENKGLAVWLAYSGHDKDGNRAWFDYRNGSVIVKNPDDEVLDKMCSIALHLEAKVLGEEGEEYCENTLVEDTSERVFKTSIIVPLSVIMVIMIHFGYIFLYESGVDQGFLFAVSEISFEVLVLSEVGIMSVLFHNKGKVDSFLKKYPKIENRAAINELKPILRTNMYSSLLVFVLLATGSLSAIMTIINDTFVTSLIVLALVVAASAAFRRYTPSEQALKQIECSDSELEKELICQYTLKLNSVQ